jgi:hypothetical protein
MPQLPARLGRVLAALPYDELLRIDVALEGAWSETVRPLWTPADGFLGLSQVPAPRPGSRPALELYFPGFWVGIHCYRDERGEFVFDPDLAALLIAEIEARVNTIGSGPPATEPAPD